MDEELRKAVEQRAHTLWEEAGQPEGRDLEFWLQAEQEIGGLSVAGEEDPYGALEDLEGRDPGDALGRSEPTDEPLRRSVEQAVPQAEQLPTAADENPISERVRDAAKNPKPRASRSTLKGGNKVKR